LKICYVHAVIADGQDHVTAAAIARRAGVGRAAVSNWRKRYAEFPKPVGGGASPVFSWAEVESWLVATGKGHQLATAGRTATGTLSIGDGPLAGPAPAPVCDRAQADLTPRRLLAQVLASLLPRLADSGRFSGSADDSDDEADEFDAELPVVLDPACGDATLLAAVADRFGDHVGLLGQELDEDAAVLGRQKLRDHPLNPQYVVLNGDSLRSTRLPEGRSRVDAVVCVVPRTAGQWRAAELAADPRWRFGTPDPGDGELAWVQHAVAVLRDHGQAVVAVPPLTGARPSGRLVRAALVRSGVLRAVIALPAGIGPSDSVPSGPEQPGEPMHVWVLHRDGTHPVTVRMIDLTEVADPADVPQEHTQWRELLGSSTTPVARSVPRMDLLDGDTVLTPSRYLADGGMAGADELVRVNDRLRGLYAAVGAGLPRPAAAAGHSRQVHVTIAELERSGALTILSRDATPRAGDLLFRTLGRDPVVATGTADDDRGIAQVVEIDRARLDPHFVALFVRADAHSVPVANTQGALSRDDVRRCRIPRLPLRDQQAYGAAYRRLTDTKDALLALAAATGRVLDQNIHGLVTGALDPAAFAPRGTIGAASPSPDSPHPDDEKSTK
jgi:hypothetical protein